MYRRNISTLYNKTYILSAYMYVNCIYVFKVHPFEKTLSGEKYKRWTMQQNGTLGRWQGQVCYWVSFLDNQNIFFPR